MVKAKILVVDDEEVVRLGLSEELTHAGYEMVTAGSGKEVPSLLKSGKVHIAFVDLWMPKMDGVETCNMIKKISPETEVVTAKNGQGGVHLAQEGGVQLALLDCWMSQMNGIQTCQAIKEISPQTHVLFMTGGSGELSPGKESLVEAGGLDLCLNKPFKEGELVNTIEELLKRDGKDQATDR